MLPRQVIKFAPKVREADRQYELNNNAELDNGVYHQDEEQEDGGACNESKQSANGGGPRHSWPAESSVMDSFAQE